MRADKRMSQTGQLASFQTIPLCDQISRKTRVGDPTTNNSRLNAELLLNQSTCLLHCDRKKFVPEKKNLFFQWTEARNYSLWSFWRNTFLCDKGGSISRAPPSPRHLEDQGIWIINQYGGEIGNDRQIQRPEEATAWSFIDGDKVTFQTDNFKKHSDNEIIYFENHIMNHSWKF